MSTEALMEPSATQGGRPPVSSPPHKSPSPPSSTSLASHLLAAVSQVQSLTSQLPPSVPIPTSSPPGLGGYRHGMLAGMPPQFHIGAEPPMSSLLAGLKDFPRQYHSPPPVPSSESHECKIVDYRGAKVAAFIINGDTMLCLPQAFELFLKHLVGGLHTVYTKLKRLSIEPIVCNVDQVRILRGLGAIQPGVNRCKLLSVKHFDVLYKDCTTASSRPGRPPKRASDFMTMSPSQESLFDLKKRHMENPGFPNGHMPGDMRMDKSPLLANGYHAPPHFNPLQYMAHHMAGLGYPPLLPGGIPAGMPGGGPHVPPHPISPNEASPLKHPHITPETLARMHEERVDRERQMALDQRRGLTPTSMAGPLPPAPLPISTHDDHQPPTSPVLNLSRGAPSECKQEERGLGGGLGGGGGGGGGGGEEEREHDLASHDSGRDLHEEERRHSTHDEDRFSDMDDDEDKDESMDVVDSWTRASSTIGQTQLTSPPAPPGALAGMGGNAPLSSTEVLLRNILGLLRVAEENARHHERQSQCEKAELKMEVLRERELRETLEKQLQEEQKNRILMQKRCAKLKKLRRRLQERLDVEMKRRSRYEDHIRSNSPDALGDINDTIRKEMEAIAKELQSEDMQQAQKQMEEREAVDRLLAPPALANHPAITAATANAAAAWR